MSEELNKLKLKGVQKISEQTHIPKQYIQAIFRGDFEGLNRVQCLGFISILQREYNTDLSELKEKCIEYFSDEDEEHKHEKVFVVAEKKKNHTKIYIIIAVIIFGLAVIYSINNKSTNKVVPSVEKINTTDIEELNKSVVKKNVELNSSKKPLIIKQNSVKKKIVKKKVVLAKKSFQIISKRKLWVGYINLTDAKKHQTVLKGTLTLDPKKIWLISLAYGKVNVNIDGKIKKFHTAKRVRFYYKDSKLKSLTLDEFKKFNNGRVW